jgi:hypothetical protein
MRALLIGGGDLADEVASALEAQGAEHERLEEPGEGEVREALEGGGFDQVAVVSRDDAVALRMALLVRYQDPDVRLLVTLFDPTAAQQLRAADPDVQITSMAEIVAPSLAGPCLGDDVVAVREDEGGAVEVRVEDGEVRETPLVPPDQGSAAVGLFSALARPYDRSAALLVYGFLGLLAVLAAETIGAMIVLDQGVIDAFYGSAKTLVTVDPNDGVAKGPQGFKLFTAVLMLLALFFEALFTAGIVNRLIDRRLTAWVGRRSVPRRNHVVVVGLGKVGLKLCLLLRAVGVRVVAIDGQEDGEDVGIAREAGIPVVIGAARTRRCCGGWRSARRARWRRSPTTTWRTCGSRWPRARSTPTCGSSCGRATASWPTRRARCSGSAWCATSTRSPRRCWPRA